LPSLALGPAGEASRTRDGLLMDLLADEFAAL